MQTEDILRLVALNLRLDIFSQRPPLHPFRTRLLGHSSLVDLERGFVAFNDQFFDGEGLLP